MTNMISSHNKKVTNSNYEANGKTCHCRNKSNCPLENKCLTNKIVYNVEANNGINELCTKIYFGISGTEFKSRYNKHQCHLETGHTKMIPKFRVPNFRNILGV